MTQTQSIAELPAEKVIRVFGSREAVAKITGLSGLQIRRWVYPKSRGGHDGQVPYRHHKVLLDAARDRALDLTLSDLQCWTNSEVQQVCGDAA